MTKEETDLIGEAIDFYNLNHFKGEKTKRQLVKLKKRIKALNIPDVSQHRELLLAYAELIQKDYTHHFFDDAVEESIDQFLSL